MGGMNVTCDFEADFDSISSLPCARESRWTRSPNRVGKTVNGVTTRYLVEDDVNPTGLPQVMEEIVGGAVQRVYTYGLQRISQDQVVNGAWSVSFYGYDGAGSVRQLTNSAGAVTDEYEYDAYGNSFTKQGTTPNNYLYRGEQYDSDLGLYYLRARYYNPATGRFLSRDPEEGKAKIPATLHKYLYAAGDPVNRIDPRGREDLVEYSSQFVDFNSKFTGPNDFGACLEKLYVAMGAPLSGSAGTNGASASLGGQTGDCAIDYLWSFINPIPTHFPWTPWIN